MDLTVTQRLKIIADTQGVDAATAEMEKLARSEESVGRSAISVERALERQRKSLDASYNSFKLFQRAQQDLIRAQEQGLGAEEYNKLSALNKQRFEQATTAAGQFTTALNKGTGEVRLARHELINLSRQIQDVGVGIASGQSPFTILVQQGTQIADVFATSSGTLRGFFGQVASGAARFIGSTTGMVTGVVAVGAAVVTAAMDFASGQKDIERALIATGRASGVTREQINKIAETSSSAFGISTKEATAAATAFAATGKIYADNVALGTKVINQFALAGENTEDKTKQLAQALRDPAKGMLELGKSYDFFTAKQLEQVRAMQAAGDLQGAQRALMEALLPKLKELTEQTSLWAKAWNAVANAASAAWTAAGKGVAAVAAEAGGGRTEMDAQLDAARANLARLQGSPPPGGRPQATLERRRTPEFEETDAATLQDAALGVAMLEQSITKLNETASEDSLKRLALDAQEVADRVLPGRLQIQQMEADLNKLRDARLAAFTPVSGAETVLDVALQKIKEAEAATIRQAQATQQLQALYPGMTIETGKTLYNLQQQTIAAAAVGTAQQLAAQQQANINVMVAQGVKLNEATAIAVAKTQLAQAQINAQAQVQLVQAQLQLYVARARTGYEKIVAQEQATIATLLAQQVPLATAVQIAATQRAAAEANAANAIKDQIDGLNEQAALIQARMNGTEKQVKAQQAYDKAFKASGDRQLASEAARATLRVENLREEEQQQRQMERDEEQARQAEQQARQQAQQANNQWVEAHNQLLDQTLQKVGEIERHWANIPGIMVNIIDHLTDMEIIVSGLPQFPTWTDPNTGQAVQFNPAGYQISGPGARLQVGLEDKKSLADKLLQDAFGGKGEVQEIKIGGFNVEGGMLIGYKVTPSEEGFKFLQEKPITEAIAALGQSDISTAAALEQTFKNVLGLGFSQAGLAPVNRLIDAVADPGTKANLIQRTIDEVMRTQPPTLAREEMINDLKAKLEQLTKSTDSLNSTMQNALSPFYSQDPRTTKLGFRAGVVGNPDWMAPGASNTDPLAAILGPGAIAPGGLPVASSGEEVTVNRLPVTGLASGEEVIVSRVNRLPVTGFANGGSFIVGGGYSANDNKMAVFPVASGEEVIVNRTPGQGSGGGNIINIDNRTIVMGSVNTDTLAKLKVSKFQQSQRMRGLMAQV